jgi:hypothetical protein
MNFVGISTASADLELPTISLDVSCLTAMITISFLFLTLIFIVALFHGLDQGIDGRMQN